MGLALVAGVVLLAVVVRALPAMESGNIYGFDPYIHLHFSEYLVEHGTHAGVDRFRDGLVDDRGNWPGVHILMAASQLVTASDMEDLFRAAPPLLGALATLMVALIALRLHGIEAAILAGMLFAVADHVVAQSSWLIQGTVGLVLLTSAMLLVALRPRADRATLALLGLVAMASLVTHHFSHLILLVTLLLSSLTLARGTARGRLVGLLGLLLPATAAYWYYFGRQTGSFPDIAERTLAVMDGPVGMAALVVVGAGLAVGLVHRRRLARWAERAGAVAVDLSRGLRSRTPLLLATGLGAAAATALVIWHLDSTQGPVAGPGLGQVTKYALAGLGTVGAVVSVAGRLPGTRFLLSMAAVMGGGYLLVLLVFTFLPLGLRFFEFVYLPLAVLSGVGVVHLARAAWPGTSPGEGRAVPLRARAPAAAVMAVVGLLLVAMAVDVQDRMTGDLAERYYHSDEEVLAARWIADHTEEDALVSAPFGVQPVVFGLGSRATDTELVKSTVIDHSWPSFGRGLRTVSPDRPVYILLTTDTTKYGEDEFTVVDLEDDVFEVGNALRRTPEWFDVEYVNDEIMLFRVTQNMTERLWREV